MDNFERAMNALSTHRINRADYVSVETAAEILNRSVRTVRYWEKAGKMPARKRFGKMLKYHKNDVEGIALAIGAYDA